MKTCPQCKMRYPNEAIFCFVDGGDLIVLKDKRIGTLVAGRYRIEEVIGEGGMATVYRATQTLTERVCAVKIMNATFAKEATVRERFRREAKSAQKLAHPNIIEIFDQGDTEDGTAYIAMEILKGKGLAEVISKGAIELQRALLIMIQLARGIARAHDLGVIHRDLKPENIFLSEIEGGGDLVKLLDFGIALSKQDSRLTGTGEIFGTPQYMAPERITSGDPGPAADIYSLGILFYEILTGQLPFDAPDIATFFQMHLKQAPVPPTKLNARIPLPLEGLILRMLAKDPKDRPVDAHRVHGDLIELARDADLQIPSVPESEAHTRRGFKHEPPNAPRVTVDVDRWARRVETFERMLEGAYGAKAPPSAAEHLVQAKTLVPRIVEVRKATQDAQKALAVIADKGRDGRQRFGFAVDALGVDASKAKDEVRVVDAHFNVVKARSEQAALRYVAAQREILTWEGRCGFQQPTTDLAQAYRTAANTVESWVKAKEEERKAGLMREANERAARDLEFQIQALRTALVAREKEIDAGHLEAEQRMIDLSAKAVALETEFVTVAMHLCEPLRMMPELWPMFEAMEADAA
jgi:tRNA A-37 threonylcarbamoyl transferase component Bud32